jgi:hypothetical protein
MSLYNAPVIKPPGIPSQSVNGDRLRLSVNHVSGRSFNCDPRQLAYNLLNGSEANMHVSRLGPPSMLWDGSAETQGKTDGGWIAQRFQGTPGNPTGDVNWQLIPDSMVPSRAEGILADLSSRLGMERGMENIVRCQATGRAVTATHISEDADRRFIVINHDDWKTDNPERQRMIEALDKIQFTDIQRTELSDDRKNLYLYTGLKMLDAFGRPAGQEVHEIDVSCLRLDRLKMYLDPEDKKLSLKLVVPDERIDFECLKREVAEVFPNHAVRNTATNQVRAYRDRNGEINVEIIPNDGSAKTTIKAKSTGLFSLPTWLLPKLRRNTIKNTPEYKSQNFATKRAIINAIAETYDLDNFEVSRVTEMRPRYVLQFYNYRETEFKEVLQTPLAAGESVVLTKALAAAEVVYLNDKNGQPKGTRKIIPLNFDPTDGRPEDYNLVINDPRPHAQFSTRFLRPVASALAGQHLIDPYVMGTDIMAAVWPKVDQLGFFGVMMLTAMAFPHGNVFSDPAKNPWFLRAFGTISHSIFDSKRDAGKDYYWLTGNPHLRGSKAATGAAMVTGPNTDAVNPARDGLLFYCRTPGIKPHMIKTAIPGSYILVIEDAEVSYFHMSMFGLLTETTINAMSAGGGLDNYQLAWNIQRGQRWNAGKCLFLMDAAGEMWIDMTRGSSLYRQLYSLVKNPESGLIEPRRDFIGSLSSANATNKAALEKAFDPKRPLPEKFKFNEAREWLNVGTWYWVSFQKIALFLSVPAMILLTVLPIPVAGSMFLMACLAVTLFGWPFWAIQMMKVGVNPKGIFSLFPIHIVWGDLAMRTMAKSGFDIERLGVGKFRISDRSLGNRLLTKDKRAALWVGGILPAAAGALLTTAATLITMAVGIMPVALTAAPVLIGMVTGRILSRIAKRLLPNPNSRSFGRSLIRWAAGSVPFALGVVGSIFMFESMAIFAIPLVTAIMAGGWSLFNGVNILRAFKRYFNEQRNIYSIQAPSPQPGTIPKFKADTWRTIWRVARGKEESALYTADEFTTSNLDPYQLWNRVSTIASLLGKPGSNPIGNLNSMIGGEGKKMIDAYGAFSSLYSFSKKVEKLAKKTAAIRKAKPDLDKLEPEDYDRLCELNRLVIEEVAGNQSPKKNI